MSKNLWGLIRRLERNYGMTALVLAAGVGAAWYLYTGEELAAISAATLAFAMIAVGLLVWRETPMCRRREQTETRKEQIKTFQAMAPEADALVQEFDKCMLSRDVVAFRGAVVKMLELAGKLAALDVSLPVVSNDSAEPPPDKVTEWAEENRNVMIRCVFWMREGALPQAQKATESDWTAVEPSNG